MCSLPLSLLPDFYVVGEEPAVNGLGGVRHEHTSLECRLEGEKGMKTCRTHTHTAASVNTHACIIYCVQKKFDSLLIFVLY